MIQTVYGKDFIPGDVRGGTVSGNNLDLASAGLLPPWAYAVYTAPFTPHHKPKNVTIYLADLSGSYWLGRFDWALKTWVYEQSEATMISRPIASAFWAIHVYAGESARILYSEFEAELI